MCVSMLQFPRMPKKELGIRIRVDQELRDAFHAACVAESRVASDVLREFMRSFADRSFNGRQQSLFIQGTAGQMSHIDRKTSGQ